MDETDWLEYIIQDGEIELVINSDKETEEKGEQSKKDREIYDSTELL